MGFDSKAGACVMDEVRVSHGTASEMSNPPVDGDIAEGVWLFASEAPTPSIIKRSLG